MKRLYRFMVILISSFLLLDGVAPLVAVSSTSLPVGCVDAFASLLRDDEKRISSALSKVLRTDENLAGELARLDQLLAHDIASSISSFSPQRRRNFLAIMDEIEAVPFLSSNAQVQIDQKTGLSVKIELLLTMHPISRGFLRHEASHLSRFVSDSQSPAAAAAHARIVMNRRLGIYREEVGSFRDQYRFLRRAYTIQDLPRLRKIMPAPSVNDVEFLKQKGVLFAGSEGNLSINLGDVNPGSEEISAAVHRFLRSQLDQRFVDDVEKALTVSQAQYIRSWIKRDNHYTKQQQEQQQRKFKSTALRWLSKIGIVAGAAAGSYYIYEEQ